MAITQKEQQKTEHDNVIAELQKELCVLRGLYEKSMEHESVKESVVCLEKWVQDYMRGDPAAAQCLRTYGQEMLEDITARLKAANENIARMDEESPAAEHITGKESNRISKAVCLAADAEKKLKIILH